MNSVVIFLAMVAFAAAAPQYRALQPQVSSDSKNAVILRYDSDNIGVDGYKYAVETSDGQAKAEQGQVTNLGQENQSIVVQGEFSYPGPDGVAYKVQYTADDDGFHPVGAHLPVPPS